MYVIKVIGKDIFINIRKINNQDTVKEYTKSFIGIVLATEFDNIDSVKIYKTIGDAKHSLSLCLSPASFRLFNGNFKDRNYLKPTINYNKSELEMVSI